MKIISNYSFWDLKKACGHVESRHCLSCLLISIDEFEWYDELCRNVNQITTGDCGRWINSDKFKSYDEEPWNHLAAKVGTNLLAICYFAFLWFRRARLESTFGKHVI